MHKVEDRDELTAALLAFGLAAVLAITYWYLF